MTNRRKPRPLPPMGRRGFLKVLGIGAGAGAVIKATPRAPKQVGMPVEGPVGPPIPWQSRCISSLSADDLDFGFGGSSVAIFMGGPRGRRRP